MHSSATVSSRIRFAYPVAAVAVLAALLTGCASSRFDHTVTGATDGGTQWHRRSARAAGPHRQQSDRGWSAEHGLRRERDNDRWRHHRHAAAGRGHQHLRADDDRRGRHDDASRREHDTHRDLGRDALQPVPRLWRFRRRHRRRQRPDPDVAAHHRPAAGDPQPRHHRRAWHAAGAARRDDRERHRAGRHAGTRPPPPRPPRRRRPRRRRRSPAAPMSCSRAIRSIRSRAAPAFRSASLPAPTVSPPTASFASASSW